MEYNTGCVRTGLSVRHDVPMPFLLRVLTTGVAIWVAAWMVPGVGLGGAELGEQALTVLLVALVFGLVNAVIGPVVRVLTFPLFILTLGLFTFVVNALLLWLTGWLSAELGLDFTVDGFVPALLGSLVVSIVSVGLNAVVRRR
jgi:putative membrane protein